MYILFNWCQGGVQDVFRFVKYMLEVIRIIVPIGLIIMTGIDIFKKVIVMDNFLDEESKDAIDPIQSAAIDAALEELSSAKNTLEIMSQNATDMASAAENSEAAAREHYDNIVIMYNEILRMYNELKG